MEYMILILQYTCYKSVTSIAGQLGTCNSMSPDSCIPPIERVSDIKHQNRAGSITKTEPEMEQSMGSSPVDNHTS